MAAACPSCTGTYYYTHDITYTKLVLAVLPRVFPATTSLIHEDYTRLYHAPCEEQLNPVTSSFEILSFVILWSCRPTAVCVGESIWSALKRKWCLWPMIQINSKQSSVNAQRVVSFSRANLSSLFTHCISYIYIHYVPCTRLFFILELIVFYVQIV